MLQALLITLVVAVVISYYPLQLHLDSLKLEEPVVVFRARVWRGTIWAVAGLVFAGMLLALASVLALRPRGVGAIAAVLPLAAIGLGLNFIILRLHISYWQHDRHAVLTVHRQEQRAEYYNKGVFLDFKLADVVQITEYATRARGSRGPLWSNYSYRVYVLQDGTELLLTCLMYSCLGPQELMPTAARRTVERYICWLPGDELNFPTLF